MTSDINPDPGDRMLTLSKRACDLLEENWRTGKGGGEFYIFVENAEGEMDLVKRDDVLDTRRDHDLGRAEASLLCDEPDDAADFKIVDD